MTTTTAHTPDTGTRRTTGPSLRTRLLGVGMIVGPVLLLLDTLQRDDSLTGLFQIYAMMGLFLALIGVTQLTEARAPRLAAVTTVIGSVGIAGGVAFGLSGLYVGAGAEDLNEGTGVAASLGLHLPGPILPLAVVLMGVLLLRTRIAPRWCGIALVAGGVLFPITRIGDLPTIAPIADALWIVGLAPLGLAVLRGRVSGRSG